MFASRPKKKQNRERKIKNNIPTLPTQAVNLLLSYLLAEELCSCRRLTRVMRAFAQKCAPFLTILINRWHVYIMDISSRSSLFRASLYLSASNQPASGSCNNLCRENSKPPKNVAAGGLHQSALTPSSLSATTVSGPAT